MTVTSPTAAGAAQPIRVWDAFVRIFHWTLAIGFFVAYFSEDVLWLHVWTGYVLGVLVLLRILWGFVGPKHARFRDFLFPPAIIAAYLFDLIRFQAQRHIGHSPAGAIMVFLLLGGMLAVTGTGLVVYAEEENAGPLAGLIAQTEPAATVELSPIATAHADEEREHDDAYGEHAGEHAEEHEAGEAWEEAHEVLANLMLFAVLLHIAGVLLASLVTRENLARSMITGRKRPTDG